MPDKNTILTRRYFFGRSAAGLGITALASLFQQDLAAEDPVETLRIQTRPLGDLLDRTARQLDQGPDQPASRRVSFS